jgi:very-short-patch-repair endonuclease
MRARAKRGNDASENRRGRPTCSAQARPRHACRPTEAEQRLWRLLRDRRLGALKFRRQVPVGPYVVDFLCVGARMILEADGSQHGKSLRDEARDAYLVREGWSVLRFWNHEILQNRNSVLETILARAGLPW